MHPLEGGELDIFETTPGPASTGHLGLVEADDGFSQSVIVRVASAANGRLNTRLVEPIASCPKTQTNSRLAPGRFDRHRPVASPRSGACRRRCRGFGFPRTRRENTVQQRDTTLSGGDLDPGPGRTWTRTCWPAALAALASTLDPSGSLFSAAVRPGQRPFSYWAQTWHSKIGIRDKNRK